MKKKLVISILILIGLVFYFASSMCYKKLPVLLNYKIFGSNGQRIPAKLYFRKSESNKNNKSLIIKELVLVFDDSIIKSQLNKEGESKLHKYLLFIPSEKIIGLINNSNSFEVKEDCICQNSENADIFTSIINNRSFFNDPPIKKAVFSKNKIIFNSFGILIGFGNEITIEYEI